MSFKHKNEGIFDVGIAEDSREQKETNNTEITQYKKYNLRLVQHLE
jgi:hypothetical protein